MEESFNIFCEVWNNWKAAILEYSVASVSKPKSLVQALRDMDSHDAGTIVLYSVSKVTSFLLYF